jgi:hypothetical protein
MTPFAMFVLFGLPMSLAAIGWGAVFLHGRAMVSQSRTRAATARAKIAG